MQQIISVLGLMDSFRGKNSALKNYEKKLAEYQEQEAEVLIDIGVIYLEDEKSEKALKHFQEALKTYEKLEFSEGEAFTHDLIGDTYLSDRDAQGALKHYQMALDIYSDINSPLKEDMAEKINDVHGIEKSLGIKTKTSPSENKKHKHIKTENSSEFKPSHEKFTTNIEKIAEKLEESIMLMENAKLYAEYYKETKTTAYLEEALNTADIIEDHDGQGTINLMMGDIILRNENTNDALNHFKKAYSIFNKAENEKGEAISLLLIGAVYFILDRKKDMYTVFKDSINLFQVLGDKKGESVAKSLISMLSQ
ncbi:tetratricopeptide repeat protein [Methanobacterium alcaliphilum]|uniref:tetratricopeptide repeat protein n=1 Tax=Methanobacterium alcaliphilum TaxID=392018 RepID=UPI00200AC049|nr:tetratricopeptide repeat protein [Methanobacterium alcaliphilum]MCK9151620.1 tetratricopeptide repeat protein [Methanobacterium alcaliphilum]